MANEPLFNLYNIVTSLSVQQINQISDDLTLRIKGYDFRYAIDPYDVTRYYIPYVNASYFKDHNVNLLAHEALAYEKFFQLSDLRTQIMVLPKYVNEFINIRKHLEAKVRDSKTLAKNIDRLLSDTGELRSLVDANTDEERAKRHELIRHDFELLLFLILLSSYSDDKFQGFYSFLREKVYIDESDDDFYQNYVSVSKKNDGLVDIVYEKFIMEMRHRLASFETDFDRFVYLRSALRDIEVVDMIVSINNSLRRADVSTIVIYLSSAPIKSGKIFDILADQQDGLPVVGDIGKFNIHRNIYQIFIELMLLEKINAISDFDVLGVLDDLRKLVVERENNRTDKGRGQVETSKDIDSVVEPFKPLLEKLASNIDNYFFNDIYSQIKDVNDANSTSLFLKHKAKIDECMELLDRFLKQEKISEPSYLRSNILTYTKSYLAKNVIRDIGKNAKKVLAYSINIQFGQDIIRNNFHHLPYLVVIDSVPVQLAEDFYSFLNILSEITHSQHSIQEGLRKYIRNMYLYMNRTQPDLIYSFFQTVITTFLNLITIPKEVADLSPKAKQEFVMRAESELIDLLEGVRRALQHSQYRYKAGNGKNSAAVEVVRNDPKNLLEIDYILLWLFRRNKSFEKAKRIGESATNLHPHDGRFFHGYGLTCISEAYDLIQHGRSDKHETNKIVQLLDQSITLLKRSNQLYDKQFKDTLSPSVKRLILKNQIAVLNSMADANVRVYKYILDIDSLYEARVCINACKNVVSQLGLKYDEYPIENATEIEIEFYEAKNSYYANDLQQAKYKLGMAMKRIKYSNEAAPMDKMFKKSITQIKRLAAKIAEKELTSRRDSNRRL